MYYKSQHVGGKTNQPLYNSSLVYSLDQLISCCYFQFHKIDLFNYFPLHNSKTSLPTKQFSKYPKIHFRHTTIPLEPDLTDKWAAQFAYPQPCVYICTRSCHTQFRIARIRLASFWHWQVISSRNLPYYSEGKRANRANQHSVRGLKPLQKHYSS